MKKTSLLVIMLTILLSVAGCGDSTGNSTDNKPDNGNVTPVIIDENVNVEVKEPELIWWKIKTNTGIPTLLCELKNNNAAPIDVVFNVDYYKGSDIVYTSQDIFANAISAGNSCLVYDTWNIPDYADEITVRYTYLEKSAYKDVPATVEKEEGYESGVNVTFSAGNGWTDVDTAVVFYFNNEPVAFDQYTFYSGETLEHDYQTLEKYDAYKIYANAYIYK